VTPILLREHEEAPLVEEAPFIEPAIAVTVAEQARTFLATSAQTLGPGRVLGMTNLSLEEAEAAGPLEEAVLNASVLLAVHGDALREAGNNPHDNPPEPFSTSKTSNWVARAGGLPPYIQHVAHAMVEKGKDTSKAISMAVGIVRNWAEGKGGVHPAIKAAAAKAIAEWEAKRAKAHAVKEAAAPAWMLPSAARKPGFRPLDKSGSGQWTEGKHPRGYGGKFVSVGSSGTLAKGALRRLPGATGHKVTGSDKSAIEAFQRRHGLKVDGVIGKQTVAAMRGNKKASSVSTGALTGEDKRYLVHQARK
jgi:hypothetical protein